MAQVQRSGGAPCVLCAVHKVRTAAAVQMNVDKPVRQIQTVGRDGFQSRLQTAKRDDFLDPVIVEQQITGRDGAVLHQLDILNSDSHVKSSFACASKVRSASMLSAVAARPPSEKAAPPGWRISASEMTAFFR